MVQVVNLVPGKNGQAVEIFVDFFFCNLFNFYFVDVVN